MEHLVLGLMLLAGSLAAGNPLRLKAIEEKMLDMAPNSFDDRYQGCSRMMEEELGELNLTEFNNKDDIYKRAWLRAAAKWQKKESDVRMPTGMRREHAVALMAYTLDEPPLYVEFNADTREAGRSREEYLEKFPFKTLHFLLTQALKILQKSQSKCYQVYRGVEGIRFTAQRHDLVRFGQFASSSSTEKAAMFFGNDTIFSVYTCHSASIRDFSAFPDESEVLIPPYEIFKVINISQVGKTTRIKLNSSDTTQYHNCEWVKEKRCKDKPCDFSAGRTIVGDPRLLWGLLLAATALAARGGP